MKITMSILITLFVGTVFLPGDSLGKSPKEEYSYKPLTNEQIIERDSLNLRADALQIKIDSFTKEVEQLRYAEIHNNK